MSLTSSSSLIPTKTLVWIHQSLLSPSLTHQPVRAKSIKPISAVHAAEPSKNPIVSDKPPKPTTSAAAAASSTATTTVTKPDTVPKKWTVDSWKTKTALQLPEYPDQEQLASVLRTLDAFPPIVFAGDAFDLKSRTPDPERLIRASCQSAATLNHLESWSY